MNAIASRAAGARALVVAALVLVAILVPVERGTTAPSEEQACETPLRRVTLYAEELAPVNGEPRLGWGLTPETATIPGPTLELIEGECMAITVVNDVPATTLESIRQAFGGDPSEPVGVSLHVHGVKYTQASDGTRHTGSWVPPGQSRTYKWFAAPRVVVAHRVVAQGTAGYWWYHDHVVGTDHGTGGIGLGLFGGVVVRRAGDLRPDRPTFVVPMGPNVSIGLQRFPDTPRYVATKGERIEFLAIGLGDLFHTFHLHGHNWANNRTGELQGPLDDTELIDAKTIGPSETFGFQVIAGESVGPGDWMLHCHVQDHSDLGMVTFLTVVGDDTLPLPPLPMAGHSHGGVSVG